jgi:hypothetical protein
MTLKRWHWIAIIVASILLVVMAPSDDGSSSGKSGRAYRSDSRNADSSGTGSDKASSKAGRVELELLSRLEMKQHERDKVDDIFNQTSWYVAPPSPPAAPEKPLPVIVLPPPVPAAPALPFTYLGRYGDTDKRTIVLARGEKVYTVKVGDVIDKTYRVEKFTFGKVNFTYLPLNVPQSLATGEAL